MLGVVGVGVDAGGVAIGVDAGGVTVVLGGVGFVLFGIDDEPPPPQAESSKRLTVIAESLLVKGNLRMVNVSCFLWI